MCVAPAAVSHEGTRHRREPRAASPRQPQRMGVHVNRVRADTAAAAAAASASVCRKQVKKSGPARKVDGLEALATDTAAADTLLLETASRRGVDSGGVHTAVVVAAVRNVGAEARQPRVQQQQLCSATAPCRGGRGRGIHQISIWI